MRYKDNNDVHIIAYRHVAQIWILGRHAEVLPPNTQLRIDLTWSIGINGILAEERILNAC